MTHPGPTPAPHQRALTIGLVLTITLAGFESLAVSTALPAIADDLQGVSGYGWVISGYMLGSLLGIVFAGWAADRHGPALPYALGISLFTAGLIGAALAPSMGVLVAARIVQGIGGGGVPAVAYVVVGRGYAPADQPRVFAIMSSAWVVPGILGPGISAFVTDHLGWRWVFAGLLPLIVPAVALTIPALRTLGRPEPTGEAPPRRGRDAVLVALGVGALLAATSGMSVAVALVVAAGGGAVALAAYIRLMPPGTLRAAPGLPATIATRGLQTFAFFGADVFVPRLVRDALGASYLVTALAVTGGTLAWTAAAWVTERRIGAVGARRLATTGLAIVAAGNALLIAATVSAGLAVVIAIVGATAAGFGMGLGYSPVSVTMLAHATPGREGEASASLNLTDVLATALGAGVGGAFVALADAQGWSPATGVQLACLGPLLVAALGVIVVTRRFPRTTTPARSTP